MINIITEDYVSFETAKLLKEKGFNEPCRAFWRVWDNHITIRHCSPTSLIEFVNNSVFEEDSDLGAACPTLQMAMKWLREKHNRFIEICTDKAHNFKDIIFRSSVYNEELDCLWESDNFSTYEESCEAAIKYCLENLI